MALYLLVEAADGYRVIFALPELDPAFTERVVLLADHRDGQPLSTAEGPLRLVVPDEKRHARWVRQVGSCTAAPRDPCCPSPPGVPPGARYPGLTGRRETPDQQRLVSGDHHITGFDHSIDVHPCAVRCNRSAEALVMIETTSAPPGSSTVTSAFTAPGAMFLTRPFHYAH